MDGWMMMMDFRYPISESSREDEITYHEHVMTGGTCNCGSRDCWPADRRILCNGHIR